jgi:hypothetical protein
VIGRNPFQIALGATACALLLIVTALLGCSLEKSNSTFVKCAPWSETVLWTRVWIGVALLLFAGVFWRRAIRSVAAPGSDRRVAR